MEVKASRLVRAGDLVEVDRHLLVHRLRVLEPIANRVGAKLVAGAAEDLTPEEEVRAAREEAARRRENRVVGAKPSKRQRRAMEAFLDEVRRGGEG